MLGGKKKFWGNNYAYDAWGNLLGKTLLQTRPGLRRRKPERHRRRAQLDSRFRQLDYQYDAAGNMTFNATPPTQTYTYDQENRLTGAAGYTYTYDGDGNRVRKSSGSTGTLYWYMTPGIVGESDLSGNLTDEYVFFDGERVARKSTNGVFYYFSDHLKTASVITDSAGNIKSESDFYPWGGELQFVNNDSNHYKFTGKERDSETQLDYFGARYYSNGLGRWVSADWSPTPIPVPYADLADPQTLNLYGYVRGLPTTKSDIDGHGFWNKLGNALASDGCWCDDEGLQNHRAAVEKQRQQDAANEQWILVDSPSAKQWAKDHGGLTPRDALQMGMLAIGGAQAGYAYGPEPTSSAPPAEEDGAQVTISRSKSPASAQHIDDAQAAGKPSTVTLDRSGAQGATNAAARGRAATAGTPTSPGMDRDEYPPKCCAEGGSGASVRSVPSGDNRSAGAQLGNQIRNLPDGTKITIKTGP